MSRTTSYTFNRFHLGDNLIFLHLLRALAKHHHQTPFVHFCNGCDIGQLREVVEDLSNIVLETFESPLWAEHEHDAIDTWKNAFHAWEIHHSRWNWSEYQLWHHGWVAERMGFKSPFTIPEHLLFDYPALHRYVYVGVPFDFMVIACEPCSGQFRPMAEHGSGYMDGLTTELAKKRTILVVGPTSVPETERLRHCPQRRSISGIGYESIYCRNIIGVATGPLWTCVNVHNNHSRDGRRFIALLDNQEQLNLPHWQQMASATEVMAFAKQEGWI